MHVDMASYRTSFRGQGKSDCQLLGGGGGRGQALKESPKKLNEPQRTATEI